MKNLEYDNSILNTSTGNTLIILKENRNNKNFHRDLLESLPVAVFTCDKNGFIDFFNKAAVDLWGKEPVIGKTQWCGSLHATLLDGTFLTAENNPMALAIKNGAVKWNEEIIMTCQDGATRVVMPHTQLITNEAGEISGAVNMLLDITEQKKAKDKIEESGQRLSLAIETAQLGTWELNVKTRKVSYSKRYLEILGYTDTVMLDHNQLLMHIHPDDLEHRNKKIAEGYETGLINFEIRILWTDKSVHWIKAQGKVFYDDEGKPDRLMGTIMDITERKMAEGELEKRVFERTAELQQANLKLERSNHELEQYAYIASHDLQEPLRKIRTYSGMLHQDLVQKYDKASSAVLQKIITSAERMSNLIYDLLNFSRLLKPDNIIEPTDLNSIVKNVINDFELALEQKKARIEVDLLPTIQAVPLQMNQLFYNLINNALKFSREDVVPKISIKSRTLSKSEISGNKNLNPQLAYIDVMVSDNGIGFEQSNAEQIFEVFKRLHTRDSYPGSGIGLALCRKIVTNHEGDIYAESVENKGSTFHAVLPIDLRRK